MIARVFRYSFAQARARTLKGKLLSGEDWHYLLKMKSLEDILRYLNGTTYARVLSGLFSSGPDTRVVSLALHDDLFGDYARLLRAVPAKSAHLLKGLLLRYEAENLKTILRGIGQGRASSEVRLLLYRLGPLSRLPVEDLLQVRQIMEVTVLLRPTIFHRLLQHALPQFQAQGKLFPLEVAIDTAAFEHMRASLRRMGRFDRRRAGDLIGELIDTVNLAWLVRFRHFYGLSAEETINYTLHGGLRLGLRDLGAAARATDLTSFISALPPAYGNALGRAAGWMQVPALLGRRFVGELHKAFLQDPFQIGLPLSYLLLKEIEIKSLESLLSTVELDESAEKLLELITLPVKGGVRV